MTDPGTQGQQGGGQQQGGSQQDSGQQQGQQSQQQQGQQSQQQQTPPALDANAIAAAARREGEGDGYAKAARELGVTVEEAKTIIADYRKRSDAEKTAEQRLTEREGELNTAREESGNHKKRADRYEKIVKDAVGDQLNLIGDEGIRELLSSMDVGGQFDWLRKHGSKYVQQQQTPDGQQQQVPDQMQQLQNLRGPDATQQDQQIPGLDQSSQQFNDILRERGLSGGVSLQ